MVSKYQEKKPHFLRKSQFLGTRDCSKSTAYMDFYSQKKRVCQISNYRANCDVGVEFFFWNVGLKTCRNRPTCFFFGPDTPPTDHFGPLFWLEKVPNLHSKGLEKAQKRSKWPFWPCNAFHRFSFTRSSV